MLEQNQTEKIKKIVEEFFEKMTIVISGAEVNILPGLAQEREAVGLDIKMEEPQILIGQGGQTLFEIQRILGMILNKTISKEYPQKIFYFNVDINNYKKQKVEYLKDLARESAEQAVLTKEEKILQPMPAHERRIIHAELAQRTDVSTDSQGDGPDRHIVIRPK